VSGSDSRSTNFPANAVALQGDGKIVVAGSSSPSQPGLARYLVGSAASVQALGGTVTRSTGTTNPAVAIPATPLEGKSFPSSTVLLAPTEALAPATASMVPGDDPGRMPVPQTGPTEVLDHALADLLTESSFGERTWHGPWFVRKRQTSG
jgi:hypothetical protein